MQYRFKRKTYGRGRTPSSRQGWLVILMYVGVLFGSQRYVDRLTPQDFTEGEFRQWFFRVALPATLLLLALSYRKGEPPRRQRGKPKEK